MIEKFQPQDMSLNNINGGNRYSDGDVLDAAVINKVVESVASSQGKVTRLVSGVEHATTDANADASVELVNGKLKFSNLKGKQGERGIATGSAIKVNGTYLPECNVTSDIQGQINNKLEKTGGTISGNLYVSGKLEQKTYRVTSYGRQKFDADNTIKVYLDYTTGGSFEVIITGESWDGYVSNSSFYKFLFSSQHDARFVRKESSGQYARQNDWNAQIVAETIGGTTKSVAYIRYSGVNNIRANVNIINYSSMNLVYEILQSYAAFTPSYTPLRINNKGIEDKVVRQLKALGAGVTVVPLPLNCIFTIVASSTGNGKVQIKNNLGVVVWYYQGWSTMTLGFRQGLLGLSLVSENSTTVLGKSFDFSSTEGYCFEFVNCHGVFSIYE